MYMIKVYLVYTCNAGTAYFDNISLTKEPCSSYTYDDKGNPVSAKEGGAKTNCEYLTGTSILSKYTASTGVSTSFSYEPTTHNLLTTTSAGVTSTNNYNSAGLLTESVSTGNGQSQKTSATYDNYGQKLTSTDTNGSITSYDYSRGHHVTGIKTGNQEKQVYTYSSSDRLSVTSMSGLAAQHYNYATGQLSSLARKSHIGTGAFTWQSYHFAYDAFGNMTQISVSGADNTSDPTESTTLASYEYESGVNNGRLKEMTFGNGNSVSYIYDKFDRTTKETYNSGDSSVSYDYTYDMAGVRSNKTVGSTTYDFTTLSGLVTRQTGGGKTIDFVYDENDQPLAMKYNGTLYYYVLNAQGDVIALADQNGNLIAKYSYDPCGKLLSVTPNGWLDEQNAYYLAVAEANPLRYRGYYYDSEAGF